MPKNIAASIKARLAAVAKQRNEDFNLILTRYGIERFLYRLSVSDYAERFVLKGAMLFVLWSENPHRPTRDLDLLGFGEADRDEMTGIFREVAQTPVPDDGLVFDPASVQADDMREDSVYGGVRVRMMAKLAKARVPIQVDVGSGDAVTPAPEVANFPTLLDMPEPRICVYPIYTVIAEKMEAVARLAGTNTRMKDFYDLWCLPRLFELDGPTLRRALEATFKRRQTPFPLPLESLTMELATRPDKEAQWQAFLRRNQLNCSVSFAEVVTEIDRNFG